MGLLEKNRSDVAVVSVDESFFQSGYSAMRLKAVMGQYNKLVFDMHAVKMVDTAGCGILLACLKQLNGSGGDLKLCRVRRPGLTMFELIRIHRIIEIFDTREKTVCSF